MRNLLIEAQTGEPAPRQVHAQFLHQLALTGDAVQITDQQNAQQELGINRGATGLAVAVSQSLAHKLKTDVLSRSAAADDSREPDLPGGSSRTALRSGRVAPS
jgi:hypothetical protein